MARRSKNQQRNYYGNGIVSYNTYMKRQQREQDAQNGVYSFRDYHYKLQKDREEEDQQREQYKQMYNQAQDIYRKRRIWAEDEEKERKAQQLAVDNANKYQQDGWKRTWELKQKQAAGNATKAQVDGWNRTFKEKQKQGGDEWTKWLREQGLIKDDQQSTQQPEVTGGYSGFKSWRNGEGIKKAGSSVADALVKESRGRSVQRKADSLIWAEEERKSAQQTKGKTLDELLTPIGTAKPGDSDASNRTNLPYTSDQREKDEQARREAYDREYGAGAYDRDLAAEKSNNSTMKTDKSVNEMRGLFDQQHGNKTGDKSTGTETGLSFYDKNIQDNAPKNADEIMQRKKDEIVRKAAEQNAGQAEKKSGAITMGEFNEWLGTLAKGRKTGRYDQDPDIYNRSDKKIFEDINDYKIKAQNAESKALELRSQNNGVNDTWAGIFDMLEDWDEADQESVKRGQYSPQEQAAADSTLTEMHGTRDSRRQDVIGRAQDVFGMFGQNSRMQERWADDWANADEEQKELLRGEMYNMIMPDDYDARVARMTPEQKAQFDEAFDSMFGEATGVAREFNENAAKQQDELAAAYRSQIGQMEGVQKERESIDYFTKWAADSNVGAEYDPDKVETKRYYTEDLAHDYEYEPQGNNADKAYYWANNVPEDLATIDPSKINKYYFIAADKGEPNGIYETFMKLYNYDTQRKGQRSNMAEMFLKGLDGYLNHCMSQYQEYYINERAEDPVAGTALRVMSPFMKAASAPIGLLGTALGELGVESAQDKNSGWYLGSKVATTVQQHQNEMAGDAVGNLVANWVDEDYRDQVRDAVKNVTQFGLQVIDSIADNFVSKEIGTALTGGDLDKAKGIIQFIMSSEATSNAMIEQLEKNRDAGEAAIYAIADGVIEWITEEKSIDKWLKVDYKGMLGDRKALMKAIRNAAITEGSEEVNSDVLNLGVDILMSLVNGHENELTENYNGLIANGMDPKEASRKVLMDKLGEMGTSFMAGLVSGGMMVGGQYVSTSVQARQTGESIRNNEVNGKTGEQALVELAEQNDIGEVSAQKAAEIRKKLEVGGKVTNKEIGQLAQAIQVEASETLNNPEATAEQIEKSYEALKSVAEITGEKPAEVQRSSDLHMATPEEVQEAKGERTNSAREVVYYDQETGDSSFAQVEGVQIAQDPKTKQYGLRLRVNVDGETRTVAPADVRMTNGRVGQIINQAAINPEFYSEGYTNLLLNAAENNQISDENLKTAMKDAQTVRVLAYANTPVEKIAQNSLPQQLVNQIWQQSAEEHAANRRAQVSEANHRAVGRVSYDGAEYGTEAWNKKTAGLDNTTRNWMDSVAGIAQRAGIEVDFRNLEDDKTYGWENQNGIGLNINGWNYERGSDGKVKRTGTRHHMMVTFGHEMTHWLQRNSMQGYNRLEQYVMQNYISDNGTDALMSRINRHMYGQQGLSLEDAISEIVADSCDQILNDESVRDHIAKTDGKLFSEIKGFVKDLVERFKKAVKGMDQSASKEARAMARHMNEISKLWTGAYDEALTKVAEGTTREDTATENRKSKADLEEEYKKAQAKYEGKDFINDPSIYSYDFLASMPDIKVQLEGNQNYYVDKNKMINRDDLERIAMNNARFNGRELNNGRGVAVTNNYTGREIIITPDGATHGTTYDSKKVNLRNARATAKVGDLAKNAIPLNSMKGTKTGRKGTYAMAAPMVSRDGKHASVAVLVIDEMTGNILQADIYDQLHSVSVREKNEVGLEAGTASPSSQFLNGDTGITRSRISIAEFLGVVNSTHKGLLSQDVLDWFGEEKPGKGYWGENSRFSTADLDAEYEEAVNSGDWAKAERMLMDKYEQMEDEGLVGYKAVHFNNGEHGLIAKLIKTGDPVAVQKAAEEMAPKVPDNAVLIPIPPHSGQVTENTDTMLLANAISEMTGRPVVVALESGEHMSRKEAKAKGLRSVNAESMGMRQIAEIPEGMMPVFIDNMVAGGETAKAAHNAIGRGITLAYAQSARAKTKGVKYLSVTKDSSKNLIPLSQRMDPEKAGNTGWKYSRYTEEAMDVNTWMMGATASTVQTEDERTLLQAYRDLRIKMRLSLKKQLDYQAKVRQLESKATLTQEQKDDLTATRNRLEIEKNKLARLEQELYDVTSDTGFAGIMYRENMKLKDYIEGKTQDQVRQSVEDMLKLVQQTQETIRKDTEELKKLAQSQAVQTMKSYLGKSSLGQMASMLRKANNSTMSKAEISDRLAEMALKQASGQDITSDTEALARELINKMRGMRTDALDYLNGTTLNIGESLLDEYVAENRITEEVKKGKNATEESVQRRARQIALRQIREQIKGSGVKIIAEGNSRLDEQWSELRENNMDLPDISGMNPSDGLNAVLDFIGQNVRDSMGANQYDIDFDEKALMVRAAVGNITTYLSGDAAARKQIQGLMNQIAELSSRTEATAEDMEQLNAQLDEVILAGQKAKGWTTVLQRDVNDAIKYYNKTAKVAAETERNKLRKQLIEQLKSENTKKLMEQQAKFNEAMQNDKKARELAQDNAALRQKISTVASRMANRIFAETDQKNVPEEAKPLVRQVLQMLGVHDSAFRRVTHWDNKQIGDILQRLTRLNEAGHEFEPGEDLDFLVIKGPTEADNDYTLRDKVWQDLMNIESGLVEYRNAEGQGRVSLQDRKAALEKTQEAISEIWNIVRARSEAFIAGKRYEIATLAEQMENEMTASRFKGERTGKAGRALDAAVKAVGYGNLTPEYYFKHLKNGVMNLLHKGMQDAENRSGLLALQAQKKMAQIAKDCKFDTWDGQEKHKVKTNRGEIELTTEQVMALYATWIREQNQMRPEETAHLLKGGFVLAKGDLNEGIYGRQKNDQRPIRMSEAQLNALADLLTEDQLKYLHAVVDYMSNEIAEVANETSMQTYGIKKFTERFYFPIKTWGGQLNKRSDAGITNKNDNRSMRQSFTKRIQANAQSAIEIGDFTPTAVNHIVGMVRFNTVGPAVENMNKVLNQQLTYGDVIRDENGEDQDNRYKRNLRAAFGDAYGQNALRYLERFMEDVNGGVTRQQDKSIQEKLLSVFRKGAVSGSLSVAAQQPLSYIRAAMIINPKYLAAAVMPNHWQRIHQEMLKYSGVAVIKDMGRFDMGQGQSMIDFITPEGKISKARKVGTKAIDMTTILPEKMDQLTWGRIWIACKLEQAALNKDMDKNSEEFMQKVAERFNEVMRRTQVYDSIMVKSQNMRSQNFAIKSMTSFMAEPTLSLNVLADAVRDFNEKGGKLKMARALTTFVMSAAAQAAVKAAMSSGRSPDKKKKWKEQFYSKWMSMFLSEVDPLTLVPGYSDLVEVLKNGELSDDAWSALGKVKSILQTGIKWGTGKSKKHYRNFEDTIGQIAQLFTNVPLKNLMRDGRAIYNFINPGTYADREYSAAVTKYTTINSIMNADNLIGLVNTYLQMADAGYRTNNTAYYNRIYTAEKDGNKQAADQMKEYITLTSNAEDPVESMNEGIRKIIKADDSLSAEERLKKQKEYGLVKTGSYVLEQYKAGKLTRKDAERLYRQENPKATDKDVMEALDKIEWEKAGNDGDHYSNYTQVYEAIDKNDEQAYRQAVKKLTGSGYYAEKDVKETAGEYVAKKYKKGEIDRKTAEKWMKQTSGMTDDEVWWKLDRIDYEKATGKDAGSGNYYRLYDAIGSNKSDDIKAAVQSMVKHGMKADNIKKQLTTKYKQAYLDATGAEKRKLMDALTKAYKAIGLTADEALKIIKGWKPKKETK